MAKAVAKGKANAAEEAAEVEEVMAVEEADAAGTKAAEAKAAIPPPINTKAIAEVPAAKGPSKGRAPRRISLEEAAPSPGESSGVRTPLSPGTPMTPVTAAIDEAEMAARQLMRDTNELLPSPLGSRRVSSLADVDEGHANDDAHDGAEPTSAAEGGASDATPPAADDDSSGSSGGGFSLGSVLVVLILLLTVLAPLAKNYIVTGGQAGGVAVDWESEWAAELASGARASAGEEASATRGLDGSEPLGGGQGGEASLTEAEAQG